MKGFQLASGRVSAIARVLETAHTSREELRSIKRVSQYITE